MREREKLVQLLMNIPQVNHAEAQIHGMQYVFECAADYLITNGVRLETNQATSEENKRWIPVTERLPDEFSEYLCRVIRPIPGGKYVRESRILWCDYDKSWNCEGLIVTHWMPLPEPPKEVE